MLYDDCDKFYIGQMGRRFIDRFKENMQKKEIKSAKSNFVLYLINENHNYTMFVENMIPIYINNKGRFINALEEFEIYSAPKIHKEQL